MKSLINFFKRQASFWAVLAAAGLILSGSAAYADESASGRPADGYVFTLNQKSAETLYKMKESRLKAIEARKAEQEAKARKQERKAKIERLQGKTGRTAKSWQVLNR